MRSRLASAILMLCLIPPLAAAAPAAKKGSPAGASSVEFAPSDAEGVASWYGPGFHGKRTANGEIYDKEKLTAAHKTLPFGTYLRVVSLDNGSSVVVRVNDRGPFAKGRIIDLSEAAARIIGMVATGTARVRIEAIPAEEALAWRGGSADGSPPKAAAAAVPRGAAAETAVGEKVRIQVASYASEANARATVKRLELSGIEAVIEKAGSVNRVVVPDLSVEKSREIGSRLDALGYRGYLVTTVKP